MQSVSLFAELLRTRPVAIFWLAALTQAALWWLVPVLFYTAPPTQLGELLAISRELPLGDDVGPPLAYWVAEFAFRTGGFALVYLVAQVCVTVALWAIFSLGRATVGDTHAALAVLLMAGIGALSVPTPDFGPSILALPLWALALLHYWRAAGAGQRAYWFALGLDLGLLLLTTHAGFVLLGLLLAFTLSTAHGRIQLTYAEPWIAGVIVLLVYFPQLIWLEQSGSAVFARSDEMIDNVRAWARLAAWLTASHAGLLLLIILAWGFFTRRGSAPQFERAAIDPAARGFLIVLALGPVVAIGVLALFSGRTGTGAFVSAPLVVLSALAVLAASPDRIRIVYQRLAGAAWAGLLLLPPVIVAAAVAVLPWIFPVDLPVAQPAADIGRFFGESFERRTGKPLAVVTGDQRLATLVALAAPSRPSLYLIATPERTPWVTPRDIEEKGAVLVWPSADTRGTPPAWIRERFPNLAPEVPARSFARRFQGRLPLARIGWAVIRPRPQPAAPVR
jgi:4-amino-4-deoxy-L-arabinose transferase-like glycosyltransferase